ncbi:hypothetical protein TSUD_394390 [Trifolium subterraneum]|uniref:Major facilitator superfamily (MFS) profile domain-containing protein n=1 Tax=Trifolium subterraneum TaxID=3900 RepID=A0A2Z6MY57_TRISU|nr:hypothetical protein TSUD_394390 [Trifolium subterraneum]
MAGGVFAIDTTINIGSKLTLSIIITCIVAASSGHLFGYDIGISAGLVSSLAASKVTTMFGRRNVIIIGGIIFLVGGAINGGSENIAMLILGRVLLGLGVGFTNQAAPLYLSEIAPPKWRGALSTSFPFFLGVGIIVAGCINYGTAKHTWGWRLSLGLAVVPAIVMTIGAFLITDTPISLVERGKVELAKKPYAKLEDPPLILNLSYKNLLS